MVLSPLNSAGAASPDSVRSARAAEFAVGQVVEAKYGREWVRGRISRIRQVPGPKGPEIAYDVNLDNGKRGVLPARMLRNVPGMYLAR